MCNGIFKKAGGVHESFTYECDSISVMYVRIYSDYKPVGTRSLLVLMNS